MKKSFVLLTAILLIAGYSIGQITTGTKGNKPIKHATVSFDEMVAYDKLHPYDNTIKMKKPKPQFVPPSFPWSESEIIYSEPPREEFPGMQMIREQSPPPDDDFQGLGDPGNIIPPDTKGIVGPEHLMTTLNTQVRIEDKEGTNISTVSLAGFWSAVGNTDPFDPKLQYDPYEERWIFICLDYISNTKTDLLVGVTETSDPTGNWNLYSFDNDPANQHLYDFPSIGFNEKWIVSSGNMFTGSSQFSYVAIYVFNKSDLYAGVADVENTRFVNYTVMTLAPATVYDTEGEDMYLVANLDGNSGGQGIIRKFKLTGDVSSPILLNQGIITVPEPWADYYPYSNGNVSPQLGSTQKIDGGDSRVRSVIQKNGDIWFSQTIFLPFSGVNRCAAQWWQLSTDGIVKQRGRVDDPTGTMFYSYPSIAVNGIGEVLVGYSSFSESQYASCSYSFRTPEDPLNTLRDPYQYKDGEGPYYKTFGGARNRWGDYSASTVDPSNDLDFFTLQEYAGTSNLWQTWWAKISRTAAPVADFSANITTVPVGSGVNFTDESDYAPTSWEWTFQGGTPSTSTEQNPQNIIYNSQGTFDVTLEVTNSSGSNTLIKDDYITASTTILPEVEFTVESNYNCVGDTVVLIDLTLYNPNEWEWEITPSGYTYINGTSSSSQNPEVIFEDPDYYTVKLTATNNNGSNSLTKDDFILAGGMSLPFEEDFESGSFSTKGWTVVNPDDDKTWEIATVGGTSPGDKAAFMNFFSYPSLRQRDQLISPAINLMGLDVIALSFKHAYAQKIPSLTDSLVVYVSGDCQQTWHRILGLGESGTQTFVTHTTVSSEEFVPELEDDWCGSGYGTNCYYLDVSEWSGSTDFRIKFESYSFLGNNLYIDNIWVDDAVAVTNLPENESGINIHPNPTTGLVNIFLDLEVENIDLRIMDMKGQLIYEETKIDGSSYRQIDMSGYPKGLYMIEMTGNDFNQAEKLILQ